MLLSAKTAYQTNYKDRYVFKNQPTKTKVHFTFWSIYIPVVVGAATYYAEVAPFCFAKCEQLPLAVCCHCRQEEMLGS